MLSQNQIDERWMRVALRAAERAAALDEVPVGAVVVRGDEQLCVQRNENVARSDATAHAEMLALRAASASLADWRLSDCTIYVTLEPCAMCAGALVLARIGRVVFGAWDEKAGMVGSVADLLRHASLNHRPEVMGGLLASESRELLQRFFQERRSLDASETSLFR